MLAVCVMAMLTGCSASQRAADTLPPRPALINHVVFFVLKDAADIPELIRDCDQRLARIPGVTSYFAGEHIDVGRSSVDSSYDVCFFVGFDSVEDYMAYVDHPEHIAVVEKWRPRWESIVVRDVLDDRPR